MGLTINSTGIKAVNTGFDIKKLCPHDNVIALAGNPNVGKSTVFNGLTGLKQHTGNWPGKTVTNAQGHCHCGGTRYILVDIPGTYSLMAHSAEEEVARNFICFGGPDAVIVVCDATCLERTLGLVLQILEITGNVVVCINLMDEARKKNIRIDLDSISKKLGVPVAGTTARKKKTLNKLMQSVHGLLNESEKKPLKIEYEKEIENAISLLEPLVKQKAGGKINSHWLSIRLLDYDKALISELCAFLGYDILADADISAALSAAHEILEKANITKEKLRDKVVSSIVFLAEEICSGTVYFDKTGYNAVDRKIDDILTGKKTGFLVMAALLLAALWLTITGANYPSRLLSAGSLWLENNLTDMFNHIGAPAWLHGALVLGVYRVLAWVVSVMLPPMAIFFPLFTLLEDLGYLPRVAFNLDKYFKKCHACGKQALTMCMGLGCNAAGVTGCRIIDSPRERLMAILTNSFVPCNGRFPTLIAIITMFFVGFETGLFESFLSAFLLTCVIIMGVFMTFFASCLLSKTVLKGVPSSFTLELPPYRRPQIGKVIVRSIFDRTLFVLGRAALVAAPAGLIIWVMANYSVGGMTILAHCSGLLNPFAQLFGMDGVILLAFILGFPANEIVVPIIIMAYLSEGTLTELGSLSDLRQLLISNGWTFVTAVSTMLFSLMHWPCSTTCLTIKKETGSLKWTAVSIMLPTIMGFAVCFVFSNIARLFI
jgi:ferrous iron transport protein B